MTLEAHQNLKRLSAKAIHGDLIVDETEKMNQAVRFRGQRPRPRPRPRRYGSPPLLGKGIGPWLYKALAHPVASVGYVETDGLWLCSSINT
jgi:hypothetical protein